MTLETCRSFSGPAYVLYLKEELVPWENLLCENSSNSVLMTYIFRNHVIIQLTKLILEKSADYDDGCEGDA